MSLMLPNSAKREISMLLELICADVQLKRKQHEEAVTHYGHIADWLYEGGQVAQYAPTIYPQGSMALETTVHPRASDEFDLDLVCVLAHPHGKFADPGRLRNMILDRIKDHDGLAGRLIPHDKCIRLGYAGNFHLDITTAVSNSALGGTSILVAMKNEDAFHWKPNDPAQYADWFDRRNSSTDILAFSARRIEPVPEYRESWQKETLRRTVQLLKRRRDVFYEADKCLPSSIVLTTLAARLYGGQRDCHEALLGILSGISDRVSNEDEIIAVTNPIDAGENFAHCWTMKEYIKFRRFISTFRKELFQLTTGGGIDVVAEHLRTMFDVSGNSVVNTAVQKYEENLSAGRTAGAIGIGAGGMVTVINKRLTIPETTFYGDSDR